jgi:SOS response regulatory protein OraA/RecX
LEETGHSPQTVKGVVARLKEARLADDGTLAFEIASSRVLHKYWGTSRIAAHLKERGIPPAIIQSTVRRIWQENDEVKVARRAVCHRFKDTTFAEASDRDKTKMVNYLRRLGFSWDVVDEVLR